MNIYFKVMFTMFNVDEFLTLFVFLHCPFTIISGIYYKPFHVFN